METVPIVADPAFPWAQVVTIIVGGVLSLATTIATVVIAWFQLKRELAKAAVLAAEAKDAAADTKTLINGRMDSWMETALMNAFEKGKASTMVTVKQAVIDAPHVDIGQKELAAALLKGEQTNSQDVLTDAKKSFESSVRKP